MEVAQWLREQRIAHIRGWDFSHLDGRCHEQDAFPWDYRQQIERFRKPNHRLLDLDTGGGEFLLSLHHPYASTAATEAYPPNVALCREKLSPLGIDFRAAAADGPLPFDDASFDLAVNRHGSFDPDELLRVLKPGGVFITQQVGSENDRELVELLLPGTPKPFPQQTLAHVSRRFANAGFRILDGQEAFRSIRFFDVGALVWFARVIEWEFPGFSVMRCLPQLRRARQLIDQNGYLEGRTHRFLLIAQKPI